MSTNVWHGIVELHSGGLYAGQVQPTDVEGFIKVFVEAVPERWNDKGGKIGRARRRLELIIPGVQVKHIQVLSADEAQHVNIYLDYAPNSESTAIIAALVKAGVRYSDPAKEPAKGGPVPEPVYEMPRTFGNKID